MNTASFIRSSDAYPHVHALRIEAGRFFCDAGKIILLAAPEKSLGFKSHHLTFVAFVYSNVVFVLYLKHGRIQSDSFKPSSNSINFAKFRLSGQAPLRGAEAFSTKTRIQIRSMSCHCSPMAAAYGLGCTYRFLFHWVILPCSDSARCRHLSSIQKNKIRKSINSLRPDRVYNNFEPVRILRIFDSLTMRPVNRRQPDSNLLR